jgi:hypothetical protein
LSVQGCQTSLLVTRTVSAGVELLQSAELGPYAELLGEAADRGV